jgi:uncharacterized membrane protein
MAEAKKQVATKEDIEKNKVFGILAYIGILFLVPLLAAPDSKFAKFHANQGLILFLAAIAVNVVWIVPILGWIVGFFGWIAVLVLAVMGIVNAASGKMEKLPIIGDIELIK